MTLVAKDNAFISSHVNYNILNIVTPAMGDLFPFLCGYLAGLRLPLLRSCLEASIRTPLPTSSVSTTTFEILEYAGDSGETNVADDLWIKV